MTGDWNLVPGYFKGAIDEVMADGAIFPSINFVIINQMTAGIILRKDVKKRKKHKPPGGFSGTGEWPAGKREKGGRYLSIIHQLRHFL
jgi:hypothetical protein